MSSGGSAVAAPLRAKAGAPDSPQSGETCKSKGYLLTLLLKIHRQDDDKEDKNSKYLRDKNGLRAWSFCHYRATFLIVFDL